MDHGYGITLVEVDELTKMGNFVRNDGVLPCVAATLRACDSANYTTKQFVSLYTLHTKVCEAVYRYRYPYSLSFFLSVQLAVKLGLSECEYKPQR
jgi:hypothetical protein